MPMSYDPASYSAGVEAIEAARDRYVAAVDPDPSARTAWQSGAIEDGFRLSLAALRALTPPAASQDSGADGNEAVWIKRLHAQHDEISKLETAVLSFPETTDVRERAVGLLSHQWRAKPIALAEALLTDCANYIDTIHKKYAVKLKDIGVDTDALRAAANLLRTPDIAATGGASGHPFGFYRELSNGVGEFQKHGHAFSPTASGFKVWALYSADAINAERKRAEKAEREMTRAIEERDHWYRQAVGDEAAMRERALQSQVTRLTEDLAARTKERDDLSAQVYVPGQWVCAKCKFTLQQMVMSAVDGSVTAQDKPGEPCPNCASPLWRTTWKQEASEMQERAIEQMERERDEARKHAANTRIRERVEGDNLRSRIDQEAALAVALQQRVGALEETLTSSNIMLVRCFNRIHGLPRTSDTQLAHAIEEERAKISAALSQSPTPNAKTEGE